MKQPTPEPCLEVHDDKVLLELAKSLNVTTDQISAQQLATEVNRRDTHNKQVEINNNNKLQEFRAADLTAATLIIQTCGQSARDRVFFITTPHEMWNVLAKQYRREGYQAAQMYLQKLIELTYRPNSNPNNFVNKFQDLARSIRRLTNSPIGLNVSTS